VRPRGERPTDRLEFEHGWLAFGMLLGIGYLTTEPSAAVRALLPVWFAYIWAACFLAGGLIGLVGIDFSLRWSDRNRYWGMVLERTGHGLHCAAVSTLGVAALYIWQRTPGAAFPVLSLALVAVWMAVTLRRIVRVTQIVKSMTDDESEPAA
jgi:hypothetical protein